MWRSPARFAPPRGRGNDRSVPRGCREPAAPLGPAGGAGSAHPLRTRRLGRGARGGLGLRLACVAQIRRRAARRIAGGVRRARLLEVLSAEADGEKGYQIAPPAMLLEQVDTTAPKIANSLAREQKARRSRFIATRASRSAAWESQLDMIRPFYSTGLGDRAEH